ncbi:MAG: acyl--CoA ligase [Caulobacteraceae bacterium]|nr:acyl--CoA ligase [Caulobacteraceae bacterium]
MKLKAPPPGPPFAPTAPNLFRYVREAHGEREFLAFGEQRLSYADADRLSAELAKGLLALGLGKGARVGILMPNNPDWVIVWMACARIGALSVLLSTFYQGPEIAWAVRHNDLHALIIADRYLHNDYVERLERALAGLAEETSTELFLPEQPHLRHIVVWGACEKPWAIRGQTDLLARAAAKPRLDDRILAGVEANITPSDLLLTICTSGSTAEPKAVVHTHGVALRATFQFLDYINIKPDDRTYTAQPFFWVGGLNINLLPTMYLGACMCFSETPDPADIIAMARREGVTRFTGWPAQAQRLRQALAEGGEGLTKLRAGLGEPLDELGRPIPPERRLSGLMGMTESFGMHSIDRAGPTPLGKGGSWGRKLPGMERLIVDPETGSPLTTGERGELFIRGHNMMHGYYRKERWEVFTAEGYFPTGDLSILDEDDYIYFVGRKGEMIKTSGANVAPPEVENALLTCPGVREAIVFGVPDATKGEVVAAVVSPQDGAALDAEGLRLALRERLSPYKVPQTFAFLTHDEIPRTASGKAIKPKLREMLFPAGT